MQSYAGTVPAQGQRDPQLVADPSKLYYDEEMGHHPGTNAPYGAVNPNVMYKTGHTVFVAHPTVVREQYCVCAPQTKAERRLLVTVIVLAVVCVALLTTLLSVLPNLLCNDEECKNKGSSGSGGGLGDWLAGSIIRSNPLQQPITAAV